MRGRNGWKSREIVKGNKGRQKACDLEKFFPLVLHAEIMIMLRLTDENV